MNEDEIMEKLSYDISEIELPPISEKVLQAVRERNESCCKTIENNVENVKVRRITTVKCVFAAIIAFLVLSIPIIVVLSNNNSNLVITEESEISDNSNYDVSRSDTPNETNNPSVLEKIKLKEVYGTVALTKRPEEECEMYLMNYDPDNSVYEDDNYLYNFDSDGNLLEIVNMSEQSKIKTPVNNTYIKDTATNLLKYYYPELINSEYSMIIEENKNCTPTWIVNFKKKNANVTEEKIRMTFDSSGILYRVILSQAENDVGNISKIEAIEIALDEIQSGKYDIPDFNREDVDIEIRLQNEYRSFIVTIDNIPVGERDLTICAVMKIDYDNGNVLYTKIMK